MSDLRQLFDEFAERKRPSNPEVARLLREVRRGQQTPQTPWLAWGLGVGGWVVAAASLGVLAKQTHEPREELIARAPDRVVSVASVVPPPEAPVKVKPLASLLPAASPPPSASAALPPRLAFDQSLLLARGHLFRIESILQITREHGTEARSAPEQQCFARQYRHFLPLLDGAQAELRKIEAAVSSGDGLALDLALERLVNLRHAADAVYREVGLCFGAL